MSGQGPEGLPWPKGDPGACEEAASALKAVGGKLTSAAGDLSGSGNVPGWSGLAALAYGAMVGAKQASVQGAAEVFTSCAAALTALGQLLTEARTQITKLGEEVKQAREAAERAQAAADEAHAHAQAATGLGVVTANAAYAIQEAAAVAAKAEYETIKAAATAKATQLVHECEDADRATAGEVGEAKVAATNGPGGLPATPAQVDIDPAALAWAYAVHIRFHPDEHSMPEDMDAALKAGMLKYHEDGKPYVDLPDSLREGDGPNAPVTYNIVEKDGIRYIVYRVFYGYNNKGHDDHEGDLELFAVQLGADGKPTHALFYGHGAPYRVPWDQVEKEGDHPVEYAASGSHAGYPEPGHYPIGHGLATDQAAAGGPQGDAEDHLKPGPNKYPYPPGTQIGDTEEVGIPIVGKIGASPQVPNDGANTEPFNDEGDVHDGKPEKGEGADSSIIGAIESAGRPILPIG